MGVQNKILLKWE